MKNCCRQTRHQSTSTSPSDLDKSHNLFGHDQSGYNHTPFPTQQYPQLPTQEPHSPYYHGQPRYGQSYQGYNSMPSGSTNHGYQQVDADTGSLQGQADITNAYLPEGGSRNVGRRAGGRHNHGTLKRKRGSDDGEYSDDAGDESDFSGSAGFAVAKRRKQQSKKGKALLRGGPSLPRPKRARQTAKTTLALGPTIAKQAVYDSNGSLVGFEVRGTLSLAGQVDWDDKYQRDKIYKRNMFHVTECSYSPRASAGISDQRLYIDGQQIVGLSLGITGRVGDEDGREIHIEQFTDATRKARRSPPRWQVAPHVRKADDASFDPAHLCGASQYPLSTGEATEDATSTCEWTRCEFRFGTEHNGSRRSAQTFHCVVLSLIARLEAGAEVTVAVCCSPQYIVLARSPAGIKKVQTPSSPGPRQKDQRPYPRKHRAQKKKGKAAGEPAEGEVDEAGPSAAPVSSAEVPASRLESPEDAGRESQDVPETVPHGAESRPESPRSKANSLEALAAPSENAADEVEADGGLLGADFFEQFQYNFDALPSNSGDAPTEPAATIAADEAVAGPAYPPAPLRMPWSGPLQQPESDQAPVLEPERDAAASDFTGPPFAPPWSGADYVHAEDWLDIVIRR